MEALRTRLGLRQVDVSKECGVNASMLSQWMLGRYKGNIARINGLMEGWLVNRRGGKPLDKTSLIAQNPTRIPNTDTSEHAPVKRYDVIQISTKQPFAEKVPSNCPIIHCTNIQR